VPGADHRFTPTRVGTRRAAARSRASRSVHPHARGDKAFTDGLSYAGRGSPPRAWGQATAMQSGCSRRSVHPHARGDKCCASVSA